MKFIFQDPRKNKNLPARLREAGYRFERQASPEEMVFIKGFEGADFPRWHLYAKEISGSWELNLHLDQKRPIYRGTSAHGGEYEGPLVKKELQRLQNILNPLPDLEITE
ncbi:MAG: hypothetical protein AAB885_03815 [Patescibacteria group bacterium]